MELLTVELDRSGAPQDGDIALPHEFAWTRNNGNGVAQTLHRFEHVAGDEDGALLLGEAAQHCFMSATPAGSMLSNGSSRNSTSEEWIMAAAKATRFRMPLLYSESVFEESVSSSTWSNSATRLCVVASSKPNMRATTARTWCA